jgi:hypothetical protein
MLDMSSPTRLTTLDYAQRPRFARRKIRWIMCGLPLILCAIGYGQRNAIHSVWQNWRWLRMESRCFAYSAPADQVVYEEDPIAAARLVQLPGYTGAFIPWGSGGWTPAALGHGRPAFFEPDVVRSFWSGWSYLDAQKPLSAILFCHRVKTTDNKEKLLIVSLDATPGSNDYGPFYTIETAFYELGTLTHEPPVSRTSASIDPVAARLGLDGPNRPPLRIYAGQIDPADPTHFTTVFELGLKRHVVDWRMDGPIHLSLSVKEK